MDIEKIISSKADSQIYVNCKKASYILNDARVHYIVSENDVILFLKNVFHIISNNIDELWINSNRIHFGAMLALICKILRKNVRIIYRAQDPVSYMYKIRNLHNPIKSSIGSAVAYFCEKLLVGLSEFIIVVGDGMVSKLPPNSKKKFVLFNTAGLQRLLNGNHNDESDVKRTGLKIGYVGLVQRNVRGLEFQLQLFRKYLDEVTGSPLINEFWILGNGVKADLLYFEKLIDKLHLNDHAKIIPGPLSSDEIIHLLKTIDIVILEPSEIHLPSKFFEYLFFGKIIVVNENSNEMINVLNNANYFYLTINFNNISYSVQQLLKFDNLFKIQISQLLDQLESIGKSTALHYIKRNESTYKAILVRIS